MLRLLGLPFLLLAFAGPPAVAHGADTVSFEGQWRGTAVENSDGIDLDAPDLSLRLEPIDNGFELEWTGPGGGRESARFVETGEQPGVFAAQASKGGWLGFMSSGAVDPLAGDPLTWARLDGDTLVVYKLVLDDRGAFTLDRHEASLQDGMLRLYLSRRAHGEPVRSLAARLDRAEEPR